MTSKTPQTAEEWAAFRFPPAVDRSGDPVVEADPSLFEPPQEEVEDEEEGGSEGGAGDALVPPPPPPLPIEWVFVPQNGTLRSEGLRKKIDLTDLDTSSKIIRLLSVFEVRPDLQAASLSQALSAACQHRFGMSVEQLIAAYPNGAVIPWKPPSISPPRL